MRLARFCLFVPIIFFVAVAAVHSQPCQPPNPCGQLLTTAGAEFKAKSSSVEGTPSNFVTIIDNDESPYMENFGLFAAEYSNETAQAITSRVTAIALGDVTARIGDLSLSGKAGVTTGNVFLEHGTIVDGRPRMGIRGGSGSAEAFLRANITDFVSFDTSSLPVGNRLLVSARLTISGAFTGLTSFHAFDPIHVLPVDGGPLVTPLDSATSVTGSAVMFASKGALLVGDSNTVPAPIVEVASFRREYGINSHGVVTESIIPPPSQIIWTFVAPNREADVMGYGFQLTMTAKADVPTTASVNGDFHGSIHWGGIVSVKDADTGAVITDWTVTSESGFDYSKSFEEQVPEPASLLLLSIALAAGAGRPRLT